MKKLILITFGTLLIFSCLSKPKQEKQFTLRIILNESLSDRNKVIPKDILELSLPYNSKLCESTFFVPNVTLMRLDIHYTTALTTQKFEKDFFDNLLAVLGGSQSQESIRNSILQQLSNRTLNEEFFVSTIATDKDTSLIDYIIINEKQRIYALFDNLPENEVFSNSFENVKLVISVSSLIDSISNDLAVDYCQQDNNIEYIVIYRPKILSIQNQKEGKKTQTSIRARSSLKSNSNLGLISREIEKINIPFISKSNSNYENNLTKFKDSLNIANKRINELRSQLKNFEKDQLSSLSINDSLRIQLKYVSDQLDEKEKLIIDFQNEIKLKEEEIKRLKGENDSLKMASYYIGTKEQAIKDGIYEKGGFLTKDKRSDNFTQSVYWKKQNKSLNSVFLGSYINPKKVRVFSDHKNMNDTYKIEQKSDSTILRIFNNTKFWSLDYLIIIIEN